MLFIRLITILAIVGAGLTACSKANTEEKALAVQQNDEQAIKQRAQARWDAMLANDYDAAYLYETPTYRSINDVTHFKLQFGGQVIREAVEIEKVEIDPEQPILATATIKIEFSAMVNAQLIRSHTYTPETWAKRDGQWWHLSKQ